MADKWNQRVNVFDIFANKKAIQLADDTLWQHNLVYSIVKQVQVTD